MTNLPPARAKKGSVVVQTNEGRLRLQMPRHLYGGNRKFLYLNLADTPENWKLAEAKAQLIESDIKFERFDATLKKYKPQTHLTVIETVKPVPQLTLTELFTKYLEFKKPTYKPTTFGYMETLHEYLGRCPHQSLSEDSALQIRAWFLADTTNSMTKRLLTHLNAAVRWGIKFKIVSSLTVSPFEGMAADLPKHNWESDPEPNAFTPAEKQLVLDAFKNHKGTWNGRGEAGQKFCFYYPMVRFWFLTGCRPSEAIGLRWCDVSADFSYIVFNGSVQHSKGKEVRVEGSKNNKRRKFPCNEELSQLLQSIKPQSSLDRDKLVFPSPVKGGAINYNNFTKQVWHKLVDPITKNSRDASDDRKTTTPYSCRDTFITEQVGKGVPSAVIAKWCDTSEKVINSTYLDGKILEHLRPL
ncbi:MAG: tyrosine-type recombinase/integrase [Oscillatoriaceae cyanobacterium Prado104]|jgi:integrase|nr:tyrosine-type recombinase/integrase [Oscillatoriaceae cyanobacterium Prado104]